MTDFTGTAGPDDWTGTPGSDTAHGGGDTDHLDGAAGDDFIYGEDGNDVLVGGAGSDRLDGGAGDDTLAVRLDWGGISDLTAGDQFFGGSGIDTLSILGSYGTVDLRSNMIAADIENLEAFNVSVRLSLAQFNQFATIRTNVYLTESATLNLAGKLLSGGIFLGEGDDDVSLAGATQNTSIFLSGNGGNDRLIGSENMDALNGGAGNDRLEGRGGGDVLDGGSGDDIMLGGDGNDVITDSFGADMMDGGAGDDNFNVDFEAGFSTADTILGGSGVDTLSMAISSGDRLIDLSSLNISGIEILSTGNGIIVGSIAQLNGFDRIWADGIKLTSGGALTVSDKLNARNFTLSDAGNSLDLSSVPASNFSVIGGAGNDTILGSSGDEYLQGGGGDDVIHAGRGADRLVGGAGADWLDGGSGDDVFWMINGETVVAGDRFTGGAGYDQIWIDFSAADRIDMSLAVIEDVEAINTGNALVDIRPDQLDAFTAIDGQFVLTGAGTVDLTGTTARGNITLSAAGNRIILDAGTQIGIQGGAGADTIEGAAASASVNVQGHGGDDRIIGGSGNDQLSGDEGNDRLEGGAGNDTLDGGLGADTMVGGAGNDTYTVDSAGDVVVELAGGGNDTIATSISYALAAGQEIETLFSTGLGINLTGNAGDNALYGDSGNNILDGGAGADYMRGSYGDDTYILDDPGDTVWEDSGQGNDTIRTNMSFALDPTANIENLSTIDEAATTAINFTGDAYDNHLVGNAGANTLDGRYGNDRLEGGAGDDVLISGQGSDVLLGGDGDDALVFGAWYTGGETADGGAGNDTLVLQGNYANTVLVGVRGVEVLLLAAGTDTRFGDTSGSSYDYALKAVDTNVAAGETLTVIATGLGPAEDVTFDGSAETNGNFAIYAGRGNDTLTGGAGSDGFFFGADGNLTGADKVVGGAGVDSIALRGNYVGTGAVVFQNASFSGVEVLTFLSGHSQEYGGPLAPAGFDYDATMADGNVAVGATLDVIAGNLRADESLRFDGRLETDGSFRIFAGAGDDTLYGGAQADSLYGGLGADRLEGGAGAESYVYRSTAESTAASRDTIVFGAGDRIDLSLIDANTGTGANDAFTWIGAAAFSHAAGELRAFQSGGEWIVEGDVNGDGAADLVIGVISATPLAPSDFVL